MGVGDKRRAGTDLRKRPRRQNHYRVKILIGETGPLLGCTIADVTQGGARLVLDEEAQQPDRFLLLLSSPGGARRVCHVVWRDGLTVGVEFPEGWS